MSGNLSPFMDIDNIKANNVNMFKCSGCMRTFGKRSTRFSHEKFCRKMQKHFCKLCKQSFQNEARYNLHVRGKHKAEVETNVHDYPTQKNSDYNCSKCERKFQTKNRFIKHQLQCNDLALDRASKFRDNKVTQDTHQRVKLRSSNKTKPGGRRKLINENAAEERQNHSKDDKMEDRQRKEHETEERKSKDIASEERQHHCYENKTKCRQIPSKDNVTKDTERFGQELEEKHSTEIRTDDEQKQSKRSKTQKRKPPKQENRKETESHENNKADTEDILNCKCCGKHFSRKNELTKHTKNGCNPLMRDGCCAICKLTFCSNSSLRRHMRRAHKDSIRRDSHKSDSENKPYKCSTCDKEFLSNSRFLMHNKICLKLQEKRFCNICKVRFCNRSSYTRHFKLMHKNIMICQNGSFVIINTETKFDSFQKLETNSYQPINSNAVIDLANSGVLKSLDDETEGEIFKTDKIIRSEMNKCLSISNDELQKDNSAAENSESKDTNMKSVEGVIKTEKIFECDVCKKTFTKFNTLCSHKQVHTKLKQCKVCGESFERGLEWKNHTKKHKTSEKLFCHICGCSYLSNSGYNKHMRKHEGKSYPCEICKKHFTAAHSLKDHMLIHKGEKPYICEICGGRFSQRAHLLRHSRTHTGERKYECFYCKKAFVDSTGLNTHMRIHMGIRPHECNLCNRKFIQISTLKTHRKTHFMKRDFQCDVCERKFTTKNSLLRHKQMHQKKHNNTKQAYVTKPTIFCDKCPKGFISKRGFVRHMQKHSKGVLPELKSDDLKDYEDFKGNSVTTLISSVHGHYQTPSQQYLGGETSGQKQINPCFINQPSNLNRYAPVESIEKPLVEISNEEYHGQKEQILYPSSSFVNSTYTEISSYQLSNSFANNNADNNTLRDANISSNYHLKVLHTIESPVISHKPAMLHNTACNPLECSSALTRQQTNSTIYSWTAGDMKTCNDTVYTDLNMVDPTQNDQITILQSNPPESNDVYIEIKEMPETPVDEGGHNISMPGADPAYGLNTLSNVVCNLEEGVNTGWKSIRFSQSSSTNHDSKDLHPETETVTELSESDSNKENKIVGSQPEITDTQMVATPGTAEMTNVGSTNHTIISDYDKQKDLEITQLNKSSVDQIEQNYVSRENIDLPTPNQDIVASERGIEDKVNNSKYNRSRKYDEENSCDSAKQENRQKIAKCELCSISFFGKKSLRRHILKNHKEIKIEQDESQKCEIDTYSNCEMQCLTCKEKFDSVAVLKNHLKHKCMQELTTNMMQDDTDDENESEKNKSEVVSPEKIENKSEDEDKIVSGKFKCSICSKKFKLMSSLKFHERKHTESAALMCEVCGKKFYKPSHMKRHMEMHVKSNEQTCFCDKCGKIFQKQSLLDSHIRTHMGLDPYPCNLCSKSFRHSSNLKRHMKGHVGGSSEIAVVHSHFCDVCGKGYTTLASLQIHMNTHKGLKPFVCDVCGTSFSQSGHLRRHMKSHSGVKSIKCDSCDKSFYDTSALRIHMRCHTGLKPYECSTCGKKFSQIQNLRTHEQKHDGIRRFKCELCEQLFTTKMALLRHENRHKREQLLDPETKRQRYMTVKKMKDKVVPCPNCPRLFTTRKSMLAHGRQYCSGAMSDGSNDLSGRSGAVSVSSSAVVCSSSTVSQPVTDTVSNVLPENIQNITEPLVSQIQVDTTEQEFMNSVTEHNETTIDPETVLNSPKQVTAFIGEDSEISIVHVVEHYSNSVGGEDPCQSTYDSRTDIEQNYSDSIQFPNMTPLVTPNADSIFVTSSLVPPVPVSHNVAPVATSNVMAPIFAPNVLGVPLNLVTLGPVSTLQIDSLPQDPYYLQEPHWR